MLVQRILTALVLATAVILAVFQLPAIYFSLFIAIIALGGAWEWLAFDRGRPDRQKLLFLAALVFPMLGITF